MENNLDKLASQIDFIIKMQKERQEIQKPEIAVESNAEIIEVIRIYNSLLFGKPSVTKMQAVAEFFDRAGLNVDFDTYNSIYVIYKQN